MYLALTVTSVHLFRGQAIHNAKIELHNIEVENRILKDALSR